MIREELVRKVAKQLNVSLEDIRTILSCFIDNINDALMKRETVDIKGFCRFKVKATRPHYVMNMKTKERYMGEPKYKIEFRINDKVKESLLGQKVLWEDLQDYIDEDLKRKVFQKKQTIRKREERINGEDRN